jgi:hypothetical protein
MTTGKELVFIFLWTLTRCVAIQLNLWDQSSENWKDFDCASQRGTCLAVEVNSGNYRYCICCEFDFVEDIFFAYLQSNVGLYR